MQYVRLVSGIFPGGLTNKEMEIVLLIMQLLLQHNTDIITQEIREKTRLYFQFPSQTMHNYWYKLKKKKIIKGTYKNFRLNDLLSRNVELTIIYNVKGTY